MSFSYQKSCLGSSKEKRTIYLTVYHVIKTILDDEFGVSFNFALP